MVKGCEARPQSDERRLAAGMLAGIDAGGKAEVEERVDAGDGAALEVEVGFGTHGGAGAASGVDERDGAWASAVVDVGKHAGGGIERATFGTDTERGV